MFHFVEFGELKDIHMLMHHTVNSYSGFQYDFALSCIKAHSETAHLLKMVAVLEMHL